MTTAAEYRQYAAAECLQAMQLTIQRGISVSTL